LFDDLFSLFAKKDSEIFDGRGHGPRGEGGGMAPPGPLLLTDIGESAIVKKINKQASRTKKTFVK